MIREFCSEVSTEEFSVLRKIARPLDKLTSSVHTSPFRPLHRGALERKTLKLKISLGNCDQKLNVSEALFL